MRQGGFRAHHVCISGRNGSSQHPRSINIGNQESSVMAERVQKAVCSCIFSTNITDPGYLRESHIQVILQLLFQIPSLPFSSLPLPSLFPFLSSPLLCFLFHLIEKNVPRLWLPGLLRASPRWYFSKTWNIWTWLSMAIIGYLQLSLVRDL